MVPITEIQLNHRLRYRGIFALVLCAVAGVKATAAPEVKVVPPEGPAHLNRVYRIVYEISWEGGASDYAILPAEIDTIDWGTETLKECRASVRDGVNVVSQVVEIIPNKTGDFKSPGIRIPFLTPEATAPTEIAGRGTVPPSSSASPSLGADPFNITVRPDSSAVCLSGGLGASLFLAVVIFWYVRRRRRARRAVSPIPVAAKGVPSGLQEALHRARQRRLDGNFYEYYRELEQAATELARAGQSTRLAATLRARAEDAGYRNARPTDDQMDGDLHDVERALARYKEELQHESDR